MPAAIIGMDPGFRCSGFGGVREFGWGTHVGLLGGLEDQRIQKHPKAQKDQQCIKSE